MTEIAGWDVMCKSAFQYLKQVGPEGAHQKDVGKFIYDNNPNIFSGLETKYDQLGAGTCLRLLRIYGRAELLNDRFYRAVG